jgi:hypothetical protein
VGDERIDAQGVLVTLTRAQTAWLSEMAAAERPPASPSELVRRLLDEAMAESVTAAGRRAHQLEVYRASGYSEHHPDYPRAPRDVGDA